MSQAATTTSPDPTLAPGHSYESVTDRIGSIVLQQKHGRNWVFGFAIAFFFVMVLNGAIGYLFLRGVGIWGINVPVAWGFAIVNFVWWIGIGHAGTLISAILLLLRQDWRTSINRFAEAMTLFAVACAGMFPLLHMGRPWMFYWMMPYPDTMRMWPQWRSPLVWDVFAVTTYAIVSAMFWFVGLIPDFATLRDRTQNPWLQKLFGVLSLGWRNSARHWQRFHWAYLLLAGLATPLVVSVHSVVAMDFAAAQVTGWHTTIFPPYFVAGAIFSGFAMVLTLAIPIRAAYGLKDFITMRHLDVMAKVMLAMGLIVAYGYAIEAFMAFYSGSPTERFLTVNRAIGPYWMAYWSLILCNVLVPQLLWFGKIRRSIPLLFIIAIIVNVGMWLERFVIIVISLHRDFVPSKWHMYYPTFWDWATLAGTIGFFLACLFLFARFFPIISMFEMRELVHETAQEPKAHP